MAYERYIKKNGKVYGPYVQHNKKVGGKVVSEYLGKKESGARKFAKKNVKAKKSHSVIKTGKTFSLIFILFSLIIFNSGFSFSLDKETILIGGGDSEAFVDYFGDEEVFFMGISNTIPANPSPSLVSVGGTNKTTEDLNCSAIIFDEDGDTLNVSVMWYKNDTLNLTINYNDDYENSTTFGAILESENTTKGDSWLCSLRFYDGIGYSSWVNSSALMILNSLPTVTLDAPADDNVTTDRTPEFSWNIGSDDDDDALTYDLNLTCYPGCSVDNRLIEDISELNHTITNYLQYLSDNNYYYNWTVRANDDEGSGEWATQRKIEIQSSVIISMVNDTISFGSLGMDEINETTDDNPTPFLLQNDGNCYINITANATNLWTSVSTPSNYLRYKMDNKSGEEDAFDWDQSQTDWANLPSSPTIMGVSVNWSDSMDSFEIDLNVTVPPQEVAGNKESTVYFIASLGE